MPTAAPAPRAPPRASEPTATATLQRILRAPGASWKATDIRGLRSAVGNRVVQRSIGSLGEAESLRRAGTAAVVIQRNYDVLIGEGFESTNKTVREVVRALDALDWPDRKPRIKLVPGAQIPETAYYDARVNTIYANQDEHDELTLWDNILFQARSALELQTFADEQQNAAMGVSHAAEPDATPADAEFDAFMRFAPELAGLGVPLSDDAMEIVARAQQYEAMPPDQAREEFAASESPPALIEKAHLPGGDLCAYELVEGWERTDMLAHTAAALTFVINEHGGATSDLAHKLASLFEGWAWPADPEKRPKAFLDLVDAAIAGNEHEDVRKVLRTLQLSSDARHAAEAASAEA